MSDGWTIAVDIAQIVGSLATAGALIAMIFIHKQQREQWLNDAFARNEAEMWLEFRSIFINERAFLERLFESFTNTGNTFNKDIKELFKEHKKELDKLSTILDTLEPCNNTSIDFDRLKKIINVIGNLYFNIIYNANTNADERNYFSYKKTEEKNITRYIIEDYTSIIKLSASLSWDIYPPETWGTDITAFTKNCIQLYKYDFDSINEALNEKVTAHLEKK